MKWKIEIRIDSTWVKKYLNCISTRRTFRKVIWFYNYICPLKCNTQRNDENIGYVSWINLPVNV